MRVARYIAFASFAVACKAPVKDAVAPEPAPSSGVTATSPTPASSPDAAIAVDANEPSDPSKPTPVTVRIVAVSVLGAELVLTLSGGSEDKGIAQNWTGCIVAADDSCVPGGDVAIVRVKPRTTTAKAKGLLEDVRRTPRVRLQPPLAK